MVKVFPANSMGANYFKDLLGPFSNIPFIAMGGINENNICTYLDSGVAAIGLGSSLVPKRIFDPDDLVKLTNNAEEFVKLVENYNKD